MAGINTGPLRGDHLVQTIQNANAKTTAASLSGGEITLVAKNANNIKWKKGSQELKGFYRQFVGELAKSQNANFKATDKGVPKLINDLAKHQPSVKYLQKVAGALTGVRQTREDGVLAKFGQKVKEGWVRFKMKVQEGVDAIKGTTAKENERIRKEEMEQLREFYNNEDKQNAKVSEKKAPPQEKPPVDIDLFLKELKEKTAERREKIEGGTGEPVQGGTGLKEPSEKPPVTQEKARTSEGISQSQIEQLVSVLKEVAPEGIGENENPIEGSVEPSGVRLSESQIEDLVSVLREVAPEGIFDAEGVDTEDTRDEVSHFNPGNGDVNRTGPSKDEVNQLVDLLEGRGTTRPTHEQLDRLNELVDGIIRGSR